MSIIIITLNYQEHKIKQWANRKNILFKIKYLIHSNSRV